MNISLENKSFLNCLLEIIHFFFFLSFAWRKQIPTKKWTENAVLVFNSNQQFDSFIQHYGDDSFTSDENLRIEFNTSNLLFSIGNILFYADITHGDQVVFIDSNLNNVNDVDDNNIWEFHRNQHLNKIKTIQNAYQSKWIPYHPWRSQTSNRITVDDHTISSIERI